MKPTALRRLAAFFLRVSDQTSGPLDHRRGLHAGQKRADHVAIAVDVATAPRRRKRAGDRAYAGGGAQRDPGQSWAGAGGRDRAIVRHRAQLESAAPDVAPCTDRRSGPIASMVAADPSAYRSSQACCDATTKVSDLMENSVPARPVYVQRGKTHIGTCDEDRRTQHRILIRIVLQPSEELRNAID